MPSKLDKLGPHRRVIGLGLAVVGLALVVYLTLFGAMFTKPARGGGRAVYEIGLVQHRVCYFDRGGVACDPVHRGFGGSRAYETLRWATLASLGVLILALAAFITNRINFSETGRMPEPTAAKGVVLFAEVLAVSLPLVFLKPSSWSLAPGFVLFELGVIAVLAGCFLRALDAKLAPDRPPKAASASQPEPAAPPTQQPEPAAPPAQAQPEAPQPPTASEAEPICRRCGKKAVFRPMHKRYHCPACGLYGPPLDLPDA